MLSPDIVSIRCAPWNDVASGQMNNISEQVLHDVDYNVSWKWSKSDTMKSMCDFCFSILNISPQRNKKSFFSKTLIYTALTDLKFVFNVQMRADYDFAC